MATQATALAPASQSALTKALSMKGEIVAYHQAATRAAEEAMENLFQCGRLLVAVKDILKHEKTTPFAEWCERFCDISSSSAYRYCNLYNDLRELTKFQRAGIFREYQSQRAVAAFLADNRKSEEKEPTVPAPKPAKIESTPPVQVYTPELVDTEEPVTKEFNIPFTTEELASTEPEPERPPKQHSPEPWAPFGRQVIDANQHIVAQCHNEQDAYWIATCINAMYQVEPCEPVEEEG